MTAVKDFFKKNKFIIIQTIVFALLPLLLCIIHCAIRGHAVWDVYIPAGKWNDELLYYKQVEAIIKGGYPAGYYGYNESCAKMLSFGAWSPVLFFPWVIWGLLFGWGLTSPIYCNIFLLSVSLVAFILLAKPDLKQSLSIGVLFCAFTPFVRYMLSCMPEITCFSLVIVLYGLTYSHFRKEKDLKLVFMFVISVLLTIMRPYMILFLAIPVFLSIKKYKKKGILISVLVLLFATCLYFAISYLFAADYFFDIIATDWVKAFFEYGPVFGIKNLLKTLIESMKGFAEHIKAGVAIGFYTGAIFSTYVVLALVMLVQCVLDCIKSGSDSTKKKFLFIELHYTVSLIAMLFAMFLLYTLTSGSKHLLSFLVAGIFIVGMKTTKYFEKTVILGIVFIYFFMIKTADPYAYGIPFVNETDLSEQTEWKKVMKEKIVINEDEKPGYDNVLIWAFVDEVEGERKEMKWQYLYAAPEEVGISCCSFEYVSDQFNNMKSKYMITITGGDFCKRLEMRGSELLYSDENCSLYKLR